MRVVPRETETPGAAALLVRVPKLSKLENGMDVQPAAEDRSIWMGWTTMAAGCNGLFSGGFATCFQAL
jgi:hypothetical protein